MTLIDKAEALLPCPFCGSTMQVAMRDAMLCLECYATGPQDEDRKTAWNRRAAIPARGVGVPESVIHRTVLDWIRDDAGVAVKMSVTPDQANALTARILAALE